VIGAVIGFLIRDKKTLVKFSGKLSMWMVYLLLFFLGIGVGMNETIVSNFKKIGLYSLGISFFSVLGSILFAFILYKFFFYNKQKKQVTNDGS
jgi:uncharacterized membrane protein YbjE (DUF340 family)